MLNISIRCALVVNLLACSAALSDELTGTLKKMKESGKISLGVRESSVPFAYFGNNYEPVGYSVDICNKIVEAAKEKIGADIKIEYVPANANNRITLIANGTIDIECASTSNLVERQKLVAFSLTHFVSNITAIVRKDAPIKDLSDLGGKSVAIISGMTAFPALQKYLADKNISVRYVNAKDVSEAFLLFEQGRTDAFVFDDVLLASSAANSHTPDAFRILPGSLRSEPNALMMRKDDVPFKILVDDTMRRLFKSGEIDKIYARWFMHPIPPRNINLNFSMSSELREALDHPNDKGYAATQQ